MTQNRSSAVMAQRVEPHDSLDDFPTPPWGTRALCEHVLGAQSLANKTVWEPACNRGYMARTLEPYFRSIVSSDVFDYSSEQLAAPGNWPQRAVHDFLFPTLPDVIVDEGVDWIITNPAFRLAEEFVRRARSIARVGVAMLVRTQFLESVGRFERLFQLTPPTHIAQFAERLPMVKGRVDPTVSTATAYCWVVWEGERVPTCGSNFNWIPPCRRELERSDDYPLLMYEVAE